MAIKNVLYLPCTYSEPTFNNFPSPKRFHDIEIDCDSEKLDKDGLFKISISITATFCNKVVLGAIQVKNFFIVQTDSLNFKLSSDDDFKMAANLLQISLSQTRLIFYQQSQHTVLKEEYLAIQSIDEIYTDIKNNVYSMWN